MALFRNYIKKIMFIKPKMLNLDIAGISFLGIICIYTICVLLLWNSEIET